MNKTQMSEAYAGRTIVVTGASGYLGDALVRRLVDADVQLIRISRNLEKLRQLPLASAQAQCYDVVGDIAETSFWHDQFGQFDIDTVFHLAGQTSAYVANDNPEQDSNANVAPMLGILSGCETRTNPPTIIFAGAATEVGVTTFGPVDETAADAPDTIYDLHKLVAEHYLKHAVRQGLAKGATLRLANVYGPGQQSGSDDRGILNRMVRTALNGDPVTIFGDGSQIRDYVHLEDVLNAFLMAGGNPDLLMGQHFIIGSGMPHSISEAFHMVARGVAVAKGYDAPIKFLPWPEHALAIEFRNFFADFSLFERTTGWRPEIKLENGIQQTVAAFSKISVSAQHIQHA
jgi:UDP-glucose 4-epimerase